MPTRLRTSRSGILSECVAYAYIREYRPSSVSAYPASSRARRRARSSRADPRSTATSTRAAEAVPAADSGDEAFDTGVSDAGVLDARSDARDATPFPSSCSAFPQLFCNFDGTCPPFAAIGIQPPGLTTFVADGGPDGSSAFRGYVLEGAGGAGFFGMPFRAATPDGPTVTPPECRAVCSADLRFVSGSSSTVNVVRGDDDTFLLGSSDGGWVHSAAGASMALGVPVTADWVHVRVVLTPTNGAVSSEITLSAGDASTVTTLPVAKRGQVLRFGADLRSGSAPVVVDVDNVSCQLVE